MWHVTIHVRFSMAEVAAAVVGPAVQQTLEVKIIRQWRTLRKTANHEDGWEDRALASSIQARPKGSLI